jgi:hypothetical protein
LSQKGQRHRSADGVADEEQSQWVSGCFIEALLEKLHQFNLKFVPMLRQER